jgi:metal-responsive CopG/Arc/MetJ family transcriptional regulator
MSNTVTVGISIPQDTLTKIDLSRGLVKRSTYVTNILEKAVQTGGVQ